MAKSGIAKGSCYQYFENKKDVFTYLLQLVAPYLIVDGAPTPKRCHFERRQAREILISTFTSGTFHIDHFIDFL